MMLPSLLLLLLVTTTACWTASAFVVAPTPKLPATTRSAEKSSSSETSSTSTTTDHRRMGELTPPEQKVLDVFQTLHDSNYNFRIVVVGKGAILETTHTLGPRLKLSQSPTSGANLLTLASDDADFEFHVQLSQVSKIVFAKRETPKKTLRIVRLLNADGDAMSSLILNEEGSEAEGWYQDLIDTFGGEIQL